MSLDIKGKDWKYKKSDAVNEEMKTKRTAANKRMEAELNQKQNRTKLSNKMFQGKKPVRESDKGRKTTERPDYSGQKESLVKDHDKGIRDAGREARSRAEKGYQESRDYGTKFRKSVVKDVKDEGQSGPKQPEKGAKKGRKSSIAEQTVRQQHVKTQSDSFVKAGTIPKGFQTEQKKAQQKRGQADKSEAPKSKEKKVATKLSKEATKRGLKEGELRGAKKSVHQHTAVLGGVKGRESTKRDESKKDVAEKIKDKKRVASKHLTKGERAEAASERLGSLLGGDSGESPFDLEPSFDGSAGLSSEPVEWDTGTEVYTNIESQINGLRVLHAARENDQRTIKPVKGEWVAENWDMVDKPLSERFVTDFVKDTEKAIELARQIMDGMTSAKSADGRGTRC